MFVNYNCLISNNPIFNIYFFQNIRAKKYKSREDFLLDVNLILKNSTLYNGMVNFSKLYWSFLGEKITSVLNILEILVVHCLWLTFLLWQVKYCNLTTLRISYIPLNKVQTDKVLLVVWLQCLPSCTCLLSYRTQEHVHHDSTADVGPLSEAAGRGTSDKVIALWSANLLSLFQANVWLPDTEIHMLAKVRRQCWFSSVNLD